MFSILSIYFVFIIFIYSEHYMYGVHDESKKKLKMSLKPEIMKDIHNDTFQEFTFYLRAKTGSLEKLFYSIHNFLRQPGD